MSLDFVAAAAVGAAPTAVATAALTRTFVRRGAAIDPLTGVPGRAGLSKLNRRVRKGVRRGERIAVVLLDMRGFKQINDTYGHDAGDMVLRAVAQRLQACEPIASVVRLGGDEFAAVATCPRQADWRALLAAIQVALADPVEVAPGVNVRPAATIGAAIARNNDNFHALMGAADLAMYTARDRASCVEVVRGGVPVAPRLRFRVRDVRPDMGVAA